MGTNYYIKLDKKPHCKHCAKCSEGGLDGGHGLIHIGKKSLGWSFLFHPKFRSFKEWKAYLKKHSGEIYNDTESDIELDDLLKLIEETKDMLGIEDEIRDWHASYAPRNFNDAEGYRFSGTDGFS